MNCIKKYHNKLMYDAERYAKRPIWNKADFIDYVLSKNPNYQFTQSDNILINNYIEGDNMRLETEYGKWKVRRKKEDKDPYGCASDEEVDEEVKDF